jgi:hypothetical protein
VTLRTVLLRLATGLLWLGVTTVAFVVLDLYT